jgi:hypothetical protein
MRGSILVFAAVLGVLAGGNGSGQTMAVKDGDSNVLMEVVDEGSSGSIWLSQGGEPSSPKYKLYCMDGNLYWSGTDISTGFGLPYSGSASGSLHAFSVTTTGNGNAGYFQINNIESAAYALEAVINGGAGAVYGKHTGSGYAGIFEATNASNLFPALLVLSNGPAESIRAEMSGGGYAGHFWTRNPANLKPALFVESDGTSAPLIVNYTGSGTAIAEFKRNGTSVAYIGNDGSAIFRGSLRVDGLPGSAGYNTVSWDPSTGRFFYETSSIRFKKNVRPMRRDFNKILDAEPCEFTDKTSGLNEIGFIAEEFVAAGLEDLVIYGEGHRPNGLKYNKISLYLLEVVKAQQKRIDEIERTVGILNMD